MAKTIVAVTENAGGGLPAELAERWAADKGKGISHEAADNIVPLIYILQANSPQAQKQLPEYIPGAEAGSIWLRNSTPPLVGGETGILFQPCYFSKDWVEWRPRSMGGGYQGRYPDRPADAVEKPNPQNPKRKIWYLPNGNEVKETRYHSGFVLQGEKAIPYMIPMTGSGHTVSKNFMFMMNSREDHPPAWAGLYRMKTISRTNVDGTWYSWAIAEEGWVQTVEAYERGRQLFDSFHSGAKQAEAPQADEADDGTL